MKSTENRVQEQSDLISSLKQEIERMKRSEEESREVR